MRIGPVSRTVLFSGLAFASAAGIVVYVNVISRVDPFAGMRGPAGSASPIEIEFHDVAMKSWHHGQLVTSGQIGRIDVHRDHLLYDLYDVTNGIYRTSDAVFHYEGAHARYSESADQLEADGGAHVWAKSYDLRAPGFKTDHVAETVTIPGPALGTLGGGKTRVSNIVYHMPDDLYKTGAISWTGQFALNLQQPDKSGPAAQGAKDEDNETRLWDYTADQTERDAKDKNLIHFVKVRGTDKDSIIEAPSGTYERKTNVITCDGPVKFWGVKANLVCDHLVVDRRKKIATATGNVVIYIKPEDKQTGPDDTMQVPPFRPEVPDSIAKDRPPAPMSPDKHEKDLDQDLRDSGTLKKYPATVHAERIVYYYAKGHRHADITGAPQAQQELPEGRWRMVWTDHAYYDGEADRLTLYSKTGDSHDTRIKDSLGDDTTAEQYVVSTKDDDDWFKSKGEAGVIVSTDEEANEAAANAGKGRTKPGDKGGGKPPTKSPPPPLQGPIGGKT